MEPGYQPANQQQQPNTPSGYPHPGYPQPPQGYPHPAQFNYVYPARGPLGIPSSIRAASIIGIIWNSLAVLFGLLLILGATQSNSYYLYGNDLTNALIGLGVAMLITGAVGITAAAMIRKASRGAQITLLIIVILQGLFSLLSALGNGNGLAIVMLLVNVSIIVLLLTSDSRAFFNHTYPMAGGAYNPPHPPGTYPGSVPPMYQGYYPTPYTPGTTAAPPAQPPQPPTNNS